MIRFDDKPAFRLDFPAHTDFRNYLSDNRAKLASLIPDANGNLLIKHNWVGSDVAKRDPQLPPWRLRVLYSCGAPASASPDFAGLQHLPLRH